MSKKCSFSTEFPKKVRDNDILNELRRFFYKGQGEDIEYEWPKGSIRCFE